MNKLESERKKKGFAKPIDLAAKAGVSEKTVVNLETDGYERPVSRKVRLKLSEALRVKESVLFTYGNRVR